MEIDEQLTQAILNFRKEIKKIQEKTSINIAKLESSQKEDREQMKLSKQETDREWEEIKK